MTNQINVHATSDPRTTVPSRTCCFSPDGSRLYEANYLGFVTVRDARTGAIIRRKGLQTALVETLRVSPDGRTLALVGAGFEGGYDFGAIKLFDSESLIQLACVPGHRDDITDVVFIDDDQFVSVGLDRRVLLHRRSPDTNSWIHSASFEYDDYLNNVACSPERGVLAIAGDSRTTCILDLELGLVTELDTPGDTNGLAFSPDGTVLAVGDDLGQLRYYSTLTWQVLGEDKLPGAIKRITVDPSDERVLLCSSYDGRVWKVNAWTGGGDPEVVVEDVPGLWSIMVAATRDRLALPSFDAFVRLIDRSSGLQLQPSEDHSTSGCNWVTVGPGGNPVVSHDDRCIRIYDRETGDVKKVTEVPTSTVCMANTLVEDRLAVLDFSARLYLLGDDGDVQVLSGLEFGPGISLRLVPGTATLIAGGYGWTPLIVSVEGGVPTVVGKLSGDNRGVIKALAATERYVAAAAGDGSVQVWQIRGEEFEFLRSVRGQPGMELCNAVEISGSTLFVGSRDQAVRSFDIQSGEQLAIGRLHTRGVKSIAVDDARGLVATGSYDRTVCIWDSRTLEPLLPPLRGASAGISGVAFDADVLYSCSFDGFVDAYSVPDFRLSWRSTPADRKVAR
jgi:WD40 repeat protein